MIPPLQGSYHCHMLEMATAACEPDAVIAMIQTALERVGLLRGF